MRATALLPSKGGTVKVFGYSILRSSRAPSSLAQTEVEVLRRECELSQGRTKIRRSAHAPTSPSTRVRTHRRAALEQAAPHRLVRLARPRDGRKLEGADEERDDDDGRHLCKPPADASLSVGKDESQHAQVRTTVG